MSEQEEIMDNKSDGANDEISLEEFEKRMHRAVSAFSTYWRLHRASCAAREHTFEGAFGPCEECGLVVEQCVDRRYCIPPLSMKLAQWFDHFNNEFDLDDLKVGEVITITNNETAPQQEDFFANKSFEDDGA